MYLLSAEDGTGLVSLERSSGQAQQPGEPATPVTYHLETWMNIGGYKSVRGWIEGDPSILQGLVPAAEVYLTIKSGHAVQIEVTGVTGNRASIRLPRSLHGIAVMG